jgi:hypothetical protein
MSPTELKMQPTIHFGKNLDIEIKISSFFPEMYCGFVAFSIPSDSLSLVKYPVCSQLC